MCRCFIFFQRLSTFARETKKKLSWFRDEQIEREKIWTFRNAQIFLHTFQAKCISWDFSGLFSDAIQEEQMCYCKCLSFTIIDGHLSWGKRWLGNMQCGYFGGDIALNRHFLTWKRWMKSYFPPWRVKCRHLLGDLGDTRRDLLIFFHLHDFCRAEIRDGSRGSFGHRIHSAGCHSPASELWQQPLFSYAILCIFCETTRNVVIVKLSEIRKRKFSFQVFVFGGALILYLSKVWDDSHNQKLNKITVCVTGDQRPPW